MLTKYQQNLVSNANIKRKWCQEPNHFRGNVSLSFSTTLGSSITPLTVPHVLLGRRQFSLYHASVMSISICMSNNLILIIMLLELLVKHDAQVKIITIDSAGFTCSLDRLKHRASKPTGPPSEWYYIFDTVRDLSCMHMLSLRTIVSKQPFIKFSWTAALHFRIVEF